MIQLPKTPHPSLGVGRVQLPMAWAVPPSERPTAEDYRREIEWRRGMMTQSKEVARRTKNVQMLALFSRRMAVCRAQIRACHEGLRRLGEGPVGPQ